MEGFLDFVLGAFTWIIEDVVFGFLGFILTFVYKMFIWVPLSLINALIEIFKFFTMGVTKAIFESQGATKTNGAAWLFGSQLGTIVTFVFILGLLMFFVSFLLTFSQKTAIDSSGSPVSAQVRRLQYLKWPMIMTFLLILGPFILITADEIMEMVLKQITGAQPSGFKRDDLGTISLTLSKIDSMQVSSMYFLRFTVEDLVDQLSRHRTALSYIKSLSNTLPTELSALDLEQLKSYLGDENLYNALTVSSATGTLTTEINTLTSTISKTLFYLENEMDADIKNLSAVLYSLQPGKFIEQSQQALIDQVIQNIELVRTDMNLILKQMTKITKGSYAISKGFDLVEGFQLRLTDLKNCTHSTFGIFLNELGAKIAETDNKAEISVISTKLIEECNKPQSAINIAVYANDSYLNTALYGGEYNTSLLVFKNTTKSTMANINIVGVMYSAITGDANGSNWSSQENQNFVNDAKAMQWVFAVLAVFGMILTIYTFTTAAIKRSFYLISYWVVGFIYLANGINNEQAVKQWTSTIIGKWWCIFMLYTMFNLVSIMLPLLYPAIKTGLGSSLFQYVGVDLVVSMALIFTLESGYQVVYQIWNKYEGSFGAAEEQFQLQKSELITEGKQVYTSTRGYMKQAGNIVTAVPSAIKKVPVGIHSTTEWWKKNFGDTRTDDSRDSFNQQLQTMEAHGNQTHQEAGQPHGGENAENGNRTLTENVPGSKAAYGPGRESTRKIAMPKPGQGSNPYAPSPKVPAMHHDGTVKTPKKQIRDWDPDDPNEPGEPG